jgi:hypothetical protein
MATRTSVGDGAWGTAGTWDTGVPEDGDDVVIASGHTVAFNVDQSAWTGLGNLTITGTLNLTATTGTYVLKQRTGKTISGAGTFNMGASALSRLPFAAKHTLTLVGSSYINCAAGLAVNVYPTEPTNLFAITSGTEAIGQTRLEIDRDLTGDIWADGDTVLICDTLGYETEIRTIVDIQSTYIDINSGLTADKNAGAYIVLISRHLNITSGYIKNVSAQNKVVIDGGAWTCAAGDVGNFNTANYFKISNGVFYYGLISIRNCSLFEISGGIFVNQNYGAYGKISFCTSFLISGGYFIGNNVVIGSGGAFPTNSYWYGTGGTFTCNNHVLNLEQNFTITGGSFVGNAYGITNCYKFYVSNVTMNNTKNLSYSSGVLDNVTFTAGTEHDLYINMPVLARCESFNHDGVAGTYTAWTAGGIVTSTTDTMPDGYSIAYKLACESAVKPISHIQKFTAQAGQTISIDIQLRKDASMTYLPRAYVIEDSLNPYWYSSTAEDSFTMTNSTNTWETDTFTVDNSAGTSDKQYTLWFMAMNASGNVYSAYTITPQATGGTSSVKIIPMAGRVGL